MQVRKSRVQHIIDELAVNPDSEFYQTELLVVEEICAKHESLMMQESHGEDRMGDDEGDDYGSNVTVGLHAQPLVDRGPGDLELTGEELHFYLEDLGSSCDDTLLRCHFEGR